MRLVCPISKLSGHMAAILYVDDKCVMSVHHHLQEIMYSWGLLLIATGGALKPCKCFYHLISFDFDKTGNWIYAKNYEKEELWLAIPLHDGSVVEIKHLAVLEAHKTLGSMTCPTGSSDAAVVQIRDTAQKWLDKASNAKLSHHNFWFLMERQFWPQVGFGICNSTTMLSELKECLQKIYWQLVPLGGLGSSVKREIEQLAMGFFGGGCPDPCVECAVAQVNKLLMHYGCNTPVRLKLQASMEFLILELSMTNQPLQLDFNQYASFTTHCWIKTV